jgi:pimeloyl-ACP methyl ester carboxylesterase
VPSVLYLHGQGGNLDTYWQWVMALWDAGYNALAIDYRGFGKSDGEASEQGLYDDGKAGLAFLRANGSIDPARIVVFGYSLGTAVATYVAVDSPTAALLLEAPFTSMTEMIEGSSPYPMPADWLTDVDFDTLGRIGALRSPLVVTHGTGDMRVPYRMGRRLFEAAPEPKRFVAVPDAGHQRAFLSATAQVLAALAEVAPAAAVR